MHRAVTVLFSLTVLVFPAAAYPTTWTIPSVRCPTLQAGIDSASAGDTVLVQTGAYFEQDIVMKPGLRPCREDGPVDCVTLAARGPGCLPSSETDVGGAACAGTGFIRVILSGSPQTATIEIDRASLIRRASPNPFVGHTRINYALPEDAHVRLAVYDVSGRLVRILVSEREAAGYKVVGWDGTDRGGENVSPGIYFCRLVADAHTDIQKILLVR